MVIQEMERLIIKPKLKGVGYTVEIMETLRKIYTEVEMIDDHTIAIDTEDPVVDTYIIENVLMRSNARGGEIKREDGTTPTKTEKLEKMLHHYMKQRDIDTATELLRKLRMRAEKLGEATLDVYQEKVYKHHVKSAYGLVEKIVDKAEFIYMALVKAGYNIHIQIEISNRDEDSILSGIEIDTKVRGREADILIRTPERMYRWLMITVSTKIPSIYTNLHVSQVMQE